jgi:hypothetical protein
MGLVSRVTPVHTAMRNCTRDEGGPFEVGNQVLISSHRKLLRSKAMVVRGELSGMSSSYRGLNPALFPPGLEFILIGDVVDLRAFGDSEARIVLQKDLAEDPHRLQKLGSVQLLVADGNHGVVEKGLVQPFAGLLVDRTAEINSGNLGTGMSRQGRHRKGISGHGHLLHDC